MSNDIATFVIPAYIKNLEYLKFLEETINCLFKQTDDSWNAIIVEDFSPVGEVKELLHKYMNLDNRINCIFLDERKSTGMCRNEGIKWANVNNSSYIIYNDADDISHPDRVKVTRKIFKENPTASVVYSKFMVIDEKSKVTKRENVSKPIQYLLDLIDKEHPTGKNCWYDIGIRTGYITLTSTLAVRTSLAVKELFPDEFVSEDSHTWLRYAARGELYFTDEIPSYYRIPSYQTRSSSTCYVEDFYATKVRVDWDGFSKALDIAIENGCISNSNRLLLEAKFFLRLIEYLGKVKKFELAFDLAMQCNERLMQLDVGVVSK